MSSVASAGIRGVSLVIPCYNEEYRLDSRAFIEFAAVHPGVTLVFVDDGSTDGTLKRLGEVKAADPSRFAVLSLRANRGKAEAVRQGILYAFRSEPRYVGYWDADLSTPLSALPDLYCILEARPELEMAIGSRVRLLGRQIDRRTARHYLGRVFATVVSIMLGLRVYDTQCGAKLLRADAATEALFATPFISRWAFDVEIFARLIRTLRATTLTAEEAVYEMPLTTWRDVAGSKLRASDWARSLADIFLIYWRVVRKPQPRRVSESSASTSVTASARSTRSSEMDRTYG